MLYFVFCCHVLDVSCSGSVTLVEEERAYSSAIIY